MNFIKFNPFGIEPKHINSMVDELMNMSLGNIIGADFTMSQPSVNIIENDEQFQIEVAAPGLDKADFNINIEKDQLIISATREQKEETGDGEEYKRREFNYASFKRSFYLPETVNADKIAAKHENGILTITLPKEAVVDTKQTIKIS